MKLRFSCAGLLLIAFAAAAQHPITAASVNDLIEKLAPGPTETGTRSIRNLAPKPRTIDLTVQFSFGSAHLQDVSKPLLASLAEAMGSDRIMSLRFSIEGHTDAVGKASYNQQLSEKRAQSVMDFLMRNGVSKDRLTAVGKGHSEPLLPEKPEAMENRRVRITTLL